jgi:hypothetical protein
LTDHAEKVRNYYRQQGVDVERARVRSLCEQRIIKLCEDNGLGDSIRVNELKYLLLMLDENIGGTR